MELGSVKAVIILSILTLFAFNAGASSEISEPFSIIVDTSITSVDNSEYPNNYHSVEEDEISSKNQFRIVAAAFGDSCSSDFNYDVSVNGSTVNSTSELQGLQSSALIEWDQQGIYEVNITGKFPNYHCEAFSDENIKILSLEQWGDNSWESTELMFWEAVNMEANYDDKPNLTQVSDTSRMFHSAASFNGSVSEWNVSNVKTMNRMFDEASSFNGSVSEWNVSNVTVMENMFNDAVRFNRDVSEWDVSNVKNMKNMFANAYNFNGNISEWDVSNVTDMSNMFIHADSFNRNISSWNVSNVVDMSKMFSRTDNFDQDLGSWNPSSLKHVDGPFEPKSASNMFSEVSLSTDNYDSLLCGWNNTDNLNNNLVLDGGKSSYGFSGRKCRESLTKEDRLNWTISDGGLSVVETLDAKTNTTSVTLRMNVTDTYQEGDLEGFFAIYDSTNNHIMNTSSQIIDSEGLKSGKTSSLSIGKTYKYRSVLNWSTGISQGSLNTFRVPNYAEVSTLSSLAKSQEITIRSNITHLSEEKNFQGYFEYKDSDGEWKQTAPEDINQEGIFNKSLDSSKFSKFASYRPVIEWDTDEANGSTTSSIIPLWEGNKRGQYIPTKPIATEEAVVFSGYQSTFARNSSTGELLWEKDDVESGYLSGLDINDAKDTVYVPTGNGVFALEKLTGNVVWSRNDISASGLMVEYYNNTIFVGNYSDNSVKALNADTGDIKWNYEGGFTEISSYSAPAAENGVVVAPIYGGSDTLIALNTSTGEKIWGVNMGDVYTSPVIQEGKVYIGSYTDPQFRAFNLNSGNQLWNASTGADIDTRAEVYNNTVYVNTYADSMFAFNAETGDEVWKRTDIGGAYDVSDPVVSDGLLYATSYGYTHEVLNPETGSTVFSYNNPSGCKYTSPAVIERESSEDTLFLADRYCGGNILAFGKKPSLSDTSGNTVTPILSEASPKGRNQNPTSGVELAITAEDPSNNLMNITFYNGSDNTQIAKIEDVPNGTYTTQWTGLSPDQTYEWYAEVSNGKTTTTNNISFTTVDIEITWEDNSEKEKGFRIYNNASGSMEEIATVGKNKETYKDYSENLEPGRTVEYQVKSYNLEGESPPATGIITP